MQQQPKNKRMDAGIQIIEQEESYTSKCSALDMEPIQKHEQYAGRRKRRGLFQAACGKLLNADVNGAVNILRKAISDSAAKQIIDSGLLFNPVKVRCMFTNPWQTILDRC